MKRNNLVEMIAEWGPYYRLSLDLIIHSEVQSPPFSKYSILAFHGNTGLQYPDFSTPAIFYNSQGDLQFTNAFIGNKIYSFDMEIDLGKWYHVEMEQKFRDGKVSKI